MSKTNLNLFTSFMIGTIILTIVLLIIFSLFPIVIQINSKNKHKLNIYDVLAIATSLFAASLGSMGNEILAFNFQSLRFASLFLAAPFVNLILPSLLTYVLPTRIVIQTKPGQIVSQENAEAQIQMTQNKKLKHLNITATAINIALIITVISGVINFINKHPEVKEFSSLINF